MKLLISSCIMILTIQLLLNNIMVLAAPLCGIDTEPSSPTAGIKKDFGVLKGLQLTANDKGYEYTLNLCSTSSQKCPDDPDEVTQGMATQTQASVVTSRCYILSQWDSTAKWTNAKDKVTLELGNGSPADCPEGLPRTFTATFTCDPNVHITKDDYTKATFTATNPAGTCQYDFNIPTCIACDAGCKSETTFFEIFLIVFIIVVCVYLLAGILLNKFYFKSEELMPNSALWAYIFGLVKDGIMFSFMLITCKAQQASYDSFGSTSKGDDVYTNVENSGNVS